MIQNLCYAHGVSNISFCYHSFRTVIKHLQQSTGLMTYRVIYFNKDYDGTLRVRHVVKLDKEDWADRKFLERNQAVTWAVAATTRWLFAYECESTNASPKSQLRRLKKAETFNVYILTFHWLDSRLRTSGAFKHTQITGEISYEQQNSRSHRNWLMSGSHSPETPHSYSAKYLKSTPGELTPVPANLKPITHSMRTICRLNDGEFTTSDDFSYQSL